MIHAALGLMIAATAMPGATSDSTTIAAKAGRTVLQRCGADEAKFLPSPDDNWTPVASVETRHVALRNALNEPMPAARSMVSIYAVGGDLQTTQLSVVITRDETGIWKGTAVGQSKIWIDNAKPSIFPRKTWELSAEKGRRLDALLDDKCYYAEPTRPRFGQASAVGVLNYTLDTKTPRHDRRVSYGGGDLTGLTREIADLTSPPAE